MICVIAAFARAKHQRWSGGQKARGQGQRQPFQGPTFSRPRTGMLEAKDQGHCRKCSPKKGLQKSFSGDLQFIDVPRFFDWGRPKPQITCNDVIRNFSKEEVFVGQRYCRMEDLKSLPVGT